MCTSSDNHTHSSRRKFLQWSGSSIVGIAALTSQLVSSEAFAASKEKKAPPKPQNLITPQEALDRLKEGNNRYVTGVTKRHDFRHERDELESGQNPYAAFLSCADSRISPELAFDAGRGDLFAVRNAGNFVDKSGVATGSLEYAVAVLKTPLIVVLGHESCGAIDAATKMQKDKQTFPGSIQGIAEALVPAVERVINQKGNLLDNAIKQNVMDNVAKLKGSSPILAEAIAQNKLMIVGGVYKLSTGQVEFL